MKRPRLKTLAAGGVASVTLLVSMAAFAADLTNLKDGSGQSVRTGFQDCVQTSGTSGAECASAAAAAPAAAKAAEEMAKPSNSADASSSSSSSGASSGGGAAAAAAVVAQATGLKDGSGNPVSTATHHCVATGAGGGSDCAEGAASAAPAAASSAASSADSSTSTSGGGAGGGAGAAAAAPAAAAASAAAGVAGLKDGSGQGVRTATHHCVATGATGGGDCPEGVAGAAAGAATAAAPADSSGGMAKKEMADQVAGPATSGAEHPAVTAGHLGTGSGHPVRTGNNECINLGHAAGSNHPADCLVSPPMAKTPAAPAPAPVAAAPAPAPVPATPDPLKTPDSPAPTAAAAVPPPEQVAVREMAAPPSAELVDTNPEGVDAAMADDPVTRWSKEGDAAPTTMAKADPTETVGTTPEGADAGAAGDPATRWSREGGAAAAPDTPYPAPMPTFPTIGEAPAEPTGAVNAGDAPPFELPSGTEMAAAPAAAQPAPAAPSGNVETVPTDTQTSMLDENLDPVTKWSRSGGAAADPAPAVEQPSGPLQTPESPTPAAAAPVPPPEQVAQSQPAAAAPEPAKTEAAMPVEPAPKTAPDGRPMVAAPEYERFTLGADALFKFNKYTTKFMLPEGRAKLDDLADKLTHYTGVKSIDITGHTDRVGTHKYNDRLSVRRAATVKQYLAGKGVDANLMKISGKGKRQPVVFCKGKKVTAKLKACLQPNRRVEVEVRGERQKP